MEMMKKMVFGALTLSFLLFVVSYYSDIAKNSQNLAQVSTPSFENLNSWWKFDEGFGSTASDSVGSSTGTIVGASWTTGKTGHALSFDGVNDYVSLGSGSALSPTSAITITAWIKTNTISTGQMILSKYREGSSYPYQLRIQEGGNVRFSIKTSSEVSLTTNNSPIPINHWKHIVGVWDGSTMKVYIDGVLASPTANQSGTMSNTETDTRIGAASLGGLPFNGVIDEVQLYHRALSAEEVLSLFNTGKISSPTETSQTTSETSTDVTTPESTPTTEEHVVGTESQTPTPTVTLSASPASITSGQSSTLTWSSTNATSCTAGGGWSGTKTTSGNQAVSPTSNTTYTITCAKESFSASANTTVNVATHTPTVPTYTFLINDSIKTTDKLNVRTEPSGRRIDSQPAGAKGKIVFGPVKLREFTWWQIDFANAPDGWVVENYIVKDSATSPTPTPTVTLSASPASITSGQSSTLTWSSTNATSCTAGGGWSGTKTTSGNQAVSPTSNTTYTITCTGAGGTTTQSTTVTVTTIVVPPSTKFIIGDNIQTTSVLNVRSTANGTLLGTQVLGATGKIIGGPIYTGGYHWWNVDYTFGVDGWSAENYLMKAVVVLPAPTITLSASPAAITSGQSSTLSWSSTNATSCTASGGWTGTKTTSGTQTVSPSSSTSYTLTCIGPGGSDVKTINISVGAVTPPTTGSTINISAIVQSFNTLGQGIVSSGFPLREGDLKEADITNNKICVFVNGIEQGTYIEALGGRFQDGSIRSVLIQFPYNISSTSPINAEVRIGTTCAVPHIAKTRVSDQVYLSARVILPSDPAFLSDTWVTFQPMLPASSESSIAKAYFTTFLDFQFENGFPYSWHPNPVPGKLYELTAGSYQSTYESTRSLFAAWQKTGDTKYFYNAYQRAWHQLTKYSLPVKGYGYTPDPNPNGLPGNGSGLTAEWNSQRYVGLASAYLLTGLEEYRNSVALAASWKYGGIDTKAKATDPNSGWIDPSYPGRFNIISTWAAGLTTLIDASQAYSGGAGGYGPRQTVTNPDVRLPWILDAWELNKFAKGDFRDGLVGTSPTATNGGTAAPGDIPLFQVALLGDYLIFYYTNIQADPRIPGWLQKMADIAIGQTVALQSGDTCYGTGPVWGYNYNLSSTQGRSGGVAPYTLPMWSNVFAFNYAKTGDSKYLTWYQRAADKRNVEPGYCLYWAWKYWGESFGNVMSAPYYAQKGMPKLPQAIRIPPPPGTTPITSQ